MFIISGFRQKRLQSGQKCIVRRFCSHDPSFFCNVEMAEKADHFLRAFRDQFLDTYYNQILDPKLRENKEAKQKDIWFTRLLFEAAFGRIRGLSYETYKDDWDDNKWKYKFCYNSFGRWVDARVTIDQKQHDNTRINTDPVIKNSWWSPIDGFLIKTAHYALLQDEWNATANPTSSFLAWAWLLMTIRKGDRN